MRSYIPKIITYVLMPIMFFSGLTACSQQDEQVASKKEQKRMVFQKLEIDKVPEGATLDGYLVGENVADRLSYHGASDILHSLGDSNPGVRFRNDDINKDGVLQERVMAEFRAGKKVYVVDFNGDKKAWGIEGKVAGPVDVMLYTK